MPGFDETRVTQALENCGGKFAAIAAPAAAEHQANSLHLWQQDLSRTDELRSIAIVVLNGLVR